MTTWACGAASMAASVPPGRGAETWRISRAQPACSLAAGLLEPLDAARRGAPG